MAKKRLKKIATAESCTGGLLGHLLTQKAGSSDFYLGGVVCYADRIKSLLLGIPKSVLKKQGAVSRDVALRMAEGVRRRFGADLGVGITGIAGPGGGSKAKPVGLVYIALSKRAGTDCERFEFSGKRSAIKRKAAQKALAWVKREMS
jgi:PncC family amidohydrolase